VVIDIVLPAMLGLILVREAGVKAYDFEGQWSAYELYEGWNVPAG
jgi:hypothetical protein